MSRCFPFPPPGFESKARPDDVNLIIKEKQKQKKHKHKKDKDKKERSERKEQERSEGKHKEDKKRKRKKHRDKKDKKKDKQSSSEEKKFVGSLENQNGGKLVPDSKPTDGFQDQQTFSELGKKVRNDSGATDNHMVQKITLVEKRKANLPGKVQENSNGMLAGAYDDIKDKREHIKMANGQSLRVDTRSLGNGSVGNCNGEIRIKVEGGSCQVDKVEKRKEGKERNGYRNIFGEGDGREDEDRNENTKAKDKRRKEEKKKEKMTGGSKEKIKQGATDGIFLDFRANNHSDLVKESRDCQGKLPKHKELNDFLHDNGIWPNNMSRPALLCHQAGQNGSGFRPSQNIVNLAVKKGADITDQKVNGKLSSPQPLIKNQRNMEPCHTANNSVAEHDSVSTNNHGLRNGLTSPHLVHSERKTEPCQTTNCVAKVKHIVNDHRIPDERIPSSCPLLENGRKMTLQRPDAVHKTDNKELTMSGSLECQKDTSSRPSSGSTKSKEKVGTSLKPPHPDLKYLSQILTVPEVEWPQCDNQEWLFGCKDSPTKRPKLASPQIQWTKQVWAEAIQVDSADVIAMPYVIPY